MYTCCKIMHTLEFQKYYGFHIHYLWANKTNHTWQFFVFHVKRKIKLTWPYKDAHVNSFFPHTARLMNSVSAKCFPVTCDLNTLRSRVNRHYFFFGLFLNNFPIFISFFPSSSFGTCSGCSALHGVKAN